MQPLRILLIEDNSRDAELLEAKLRDDGFPDVELVCVATWPELHEQLKQNGSYHLVLSDYSLPGFDGLLALERVREHWPEVPFVFVSGAIGEERAIETLKLGATDYVLKHHLGALAPAITRALQEAEDHRERHRAEEDLRALNATLEQRVAERTALAEQRATELHRLAIELTKAEQCERERVAEILQEELQQWLFGAQLQLGLLESECGKKHQERIRKVIDILSHSSAVSQSLVIDLSPPVLSVQGLAAALEWQATRTFEQHQLVVQVDADPRANPTNPHVSMLLLRAVRELLFNVVKYAQVSLASVTMQRKKHLAQNCVRVEVSDQGQGFDTKQPIRTEQSFGLVSIQQRLALLGGDCEIISQIGAGTRVVLWVPLA